MFKLFSAFAVALLLPGFAWSAESCHPEDTMMADGNAIASVHHADHAVPPVSSRGMEEVPLTAPVSSSEMQGMTKDCVQHSGAVARTCTMQNVLMKCGMHGCCLKSEVPVADDSLSPKVSPEMAIDAHAGLDPFFHEGPVSPYLLETISNYYPPVPRPPSA